MKIGETFLRLFLMVHWENLYFLLSSILVVLLALIFYCQRNKNFYEESPKYYFKLKIQTHSNSLGSLSF